MRYRNLNQYIPQEKREELNEKILYCIDNDLCDKMGITKEVIYNTYTGVGGLHGKNFNDYSSFHDFTKAKQSIENGQFFTGHNESKLLIDILGINTGESVMDITCGKGDLFNFIPSNCVIYGNELDFKAYKVCKYLYPDVVLSKGDMREYNPRIKVDTVIGNPPFNLRLNHNGITKYSQRIYVEKSLELLNTGGLMALIVPKSFLDDEFHNKADIEYMNDNFNFVCQTALDPKAFTHVGVENFETKIIVFSKKSEFIPNREFDNSYVNCNAQLIYENYIKPIRELQEKFKSNIKLENNKNYDGDKDFDDKVTKLLFDIKRTKSISHKYVECFNYYNEFYNQKCPESMKYDEWNKIRVTKDKVLKKLKNVLGGQHNRVVIKSENPYKKKLKQEREYLIQSKPFDLVEINENIDKWLKEKSLFDSIKEEETHLTDMQRHDLNKLLQKRYNYICWEMGSGKSYSSLYYGLYRLEKNNCRNIFVVAPAIAIKNTYIEMLENFNIPYIVINNTKDIYNIKKGQFILMTFNMLIKNQKHLKKKFINVYKKNLCLILDEADGISNINSKRCKATLNCFRRLPYKVLLSGTSVRNSINEIYSQLELLYNNSYNMICNNSLMYITDDDSKSLKTVDNPVYNKPYPPYKKGYEIFCNSHLPKKVSVFGVSKFDQNIYNKDNLKKILDNTIITRTLKDIVGRDLYNINQVTCKFNEDEEILYKKILDDFYTMSSEYHIKTGNSRKDSMFKILAQLNTLLKCCSTPHTFREYSGNEISSKIKKVFDIVDRFENERIAIGCTRVKTVNTYVYELRKRYPNRRIFTIIGNETTLQQRKNIVEDMKRFNDCIIVSTQQALSCSMNIGFVNVVVTPEMNWNDSSIAQYRARFSRMNSEEKTEIFNVFYEKSIEVNLLKLNMVKEKLCLFMKNEDLEDSELYEKYGIDEWMLNSLMVKEKDSEGRVNITWGEQEII